MRDGRPTRPALFALSEARRIARLGGASVYAVVATLPLTTVELEAMARPIAEAGADKLLLCEADDFFVPADDARQGRALDLTTSRVPPMFFLFPPGGAAAALGPPLAARLGGVFASHCDLVTSDADLVPADKRCRAQLLRLRPDELSHERLDPIVLGRPIVASLTAGRMVPGRGRVQFMEIEVIATGKLAHPSLPVEEARAPDPNGAFELASVVVLIGDPNQAGAIPGIEAKELALRASPGVVVASVTDVPSAVLGQCCPEILLKIGPCIGTVARSPRTRVLLVALSGLTEPPADDIDVLWEVRSPTDASTEVLAELLSRIGDSA